MVILFHLLAALAGALATLLAAWPLWRSGRVRTALALGLAGAAATPLLYALVGTPAALRPPLPATVEDTDPATARARLQAETAALRQRLADAPDQAGGWILLARAEALLGNGKAAGQAWQRVLALEPDNPALLVEAAQARADAEPQRRIDDTALGWLEQARRIDPQAQRALWLIGIAQRQRGQAAEAAATWEQLLPLLEGPTAAGVREQIDKARADAGLPPRTGARDPSPGVDGTVRLTVHVVPDPALAGRGLDPATPVFVQARAPDGPPLPVAVRRLTLGQLPATVVLSDADSVMPGQVLSAQAQVAVSARLALSGSVARSAGDIETAARLVRPAEAGPVTLVLRP